MLRSKPSTSRYITKKSDTLFCLYPHRICMQNRLDGFEYCLKHILEDKNAPYKQCNFVSRNNAKRCTNPAPKTDKKDNRYCAEHTRKALIWQQKNNRKKKPSESSESLLEQLDYYRPGTSTVTPENPVSQASKLIDYASDSDSDREITLVDQAWRGDGDSDADSVDSEYEDPLKHAGIYTAEEVALITRDKLIRLQSLYIDQFKRLQHVLKEKRRKFLSSNKMEQETIGKGLGKTTDPKEKHKVKKLQALKSYRKRRGKEALLYQQSRERRITATPDYHIAPPKSIKPLKCVHVERGIHCNDKAMPYSKYCLQHILHDPYQVLFQMCTDSESGCNKPVFGLDKTTCILHTELPEYQQRFEQRPETIEETQQIDVESHEQTLAEQTESSEYVPNLTNIEDGLKQIPDISGVVEPQVAAMESTANLLTDIGCDMKSEQSQLAIKEEPPTEKPMDTT
ncbi:KAT8 regulatory NSL complex subunit 2-like [Saccoglossus kowalevskii]|uniref:KAT8 regulatory NSL complex subunit 2 n=1 Tax=Saccoglossus kowalevskii TaxID=10224 RepID=A0ABM0GXT1_SACKO|nr:PREDICTED: KAT8 regulatory NSL complex subunit 2-like isoform X1 [Saccoglossus kowalevskii]XP_006822745.1 PREDICTED: KAT8 regulatory NSL complex subunit 2-like isoform X2 [Saccoglossus kowalevskii]XP_006822746.1 PREDICTED: KAT8 regulatory NSL complex subunit 2-like isoform X3 [Saccoglossus kowalevskii]XP_006822747.1 PREDICTED: KAT8 regulatory NSL complex subunit 2-like isoform X4 [Saccoglossus kowalevskii]